MKPINLTQRNLFTLVLFSSVFSGATFAAPRDVTNASPLTAPSCVEAAGFTDCNLRIKNPYSNALVILLDDKPMNLAKPNLARKLSVPGQSTAVIENGGTKYIAIHSTDHKLVYYKAGPGSAEIKFSDSQGFYFLDGANVKPLSPTGDEVSAD